LSYEENEVKKQSKLERLSLRRRKKFDVIATRLTNTGKEVHVEGIQVSNFSLSFATDVVEK
jgi:hypothetical protein